MTPTPMNSLFRLQDIRPSVIFLDSQSLIYHVKIRVSKWGPHKFLGILSMLRFIEVWKINCTWVLRDEFEYYVPVLELSLSTTYPCTQTLLIVKNSCTQLKYLSSHGNRVRSWSTRTVDRVFCSPVYSNQFECQMNEMCVCVYVCVISECQNQCQNHTHTGIRRFIWCTKNSGKHKIVSNGHGISVLVQKDSNAKKESFCCPEP
jgi:hypothetical protein